MGLEAARDAGNGRRRTRPLSWGDPGHARLGCPPSPRLGGLSQTVQDLHPFPTPPLLALFIIGYCLLCGLGLTNLESDISFFSPAFRMQFAHVWTGVHGFQILQSDEVKKIVISIWLQPISLIGPIR